MQMVFRWFGKDDDNIKLDHVKQIPAVEGIVGTFSDIPVGEIWPRERIVNLKNYINSYGLTLEVIESVNIHEDIKLGLPSRDIYINNYIETIKNLSEFGIKVICYNFMPVFDWIRSELNKQLEDGSTVFSYEDKFFENLTPEQVVKEMEENSNGLSLPGWEPYRLAELKTTFEKYKNIDEKKLFENLKYFLERIIPTCEECDLKMAIHPDDPPWSIFGLPRIITSKENLEKVLNLVDSRYNGLTLCSGSLGANPENNIPEIIRYFGKMGRIHFGHVRNIKFTGDRSFHESSHLSKDGSLDLFEIMKAYYDIGFDGYIRPDHGRMVWDEEGRPGYGLYDRAMGITYINGLWEAINKK